MSAHGMNLFIVDDDPSVIVGLRNFLENKFSGNLSITTFNTGESALQQVNKNTHIVILDYNLHGRDGNEVLQDIKRINPKTEVIMLSSNEDVGTAVEAFRKGATAYVRKGDASTQKVFYQLTRIIGAPIRFLINEFGVSKFLAIFLMVFLTIGILAIIALQFNW